MDRLSQGNIKRTASNTRQKEKSQATEGGTKPLIDLYAKLTIDPIVAAATLPPVRRTFLGLTGISPSTINS